MAAMSTATLSKISEDSSDSVTTGFDLFSTPHTHTSVVWRETVPILPIRDSSSDLIEFNLPREDGHYYDTSDVKLLLKLRLLKEDGTVLHANARDCAVALGDSFLASLFSSVSIKLNGQDVEYEPNYPHRAFVETLLNYDKGAKETHLWTSQGWIEDKSVCKNFADLSAGDLLARKERINDGKTISLFGFINMSLFKQERFLPPNTQMTLTLRRSHPKFCLHSATATPAGGVQIKIDKSELWVTKILANPALQSAQSKVMMKANAMVRIPLNRVKTQFHVIPAGVTDWRIVLAENGQKPTRVVVGLINHKAKSGDFTLNPFRFGHNNVTHMEMLIDGIPCQRRFEPEYANRVYARTYASMVKGSGLEHFQR